MHTFKRIHFGRFLIAGLALVAVAGCKPKPNDPLVYNRKVGDAALSASWNNIADFSFYELVADGIRTGARFTIQQFPSPFTPTNHDSLDTHNVEYAHAVGLTGAGQTISIIDQGFRTTHNYLAGKVINGSSSTSCAIKVDPVTGNQYTDCDHGTAVASIAASPNSGPMVGVAPGANLHIGTFDTVSATAATNAAAGIAIVQNNSWGFVGLSANRSDYDLVFANPTGQAYINALLNFANTGIIVFAADNTYRPQIDLMAGLPEILPQLEMSFIAAINAVPTFNGKGNITNATLLSTACHQAARYCMVADGTIYSATGISDSSWAYGTGTSFSAPQIAGAVAILAEAFPGLTAQDLRARLLASADNSWFDHIGYVNFSNSVKHGFSNIWGHGFLDLAAALLPIGTSYVPLANSAEIELGEPLIVSRGAAGNAITRALKREELIFVDGMGGDFDVSGEALSAHSLHVQDAADYARDMLDYAEYRRLMGNGFGTWLDGREVNLQGGGVELAMLVPEGEDGGDHLGVTMRRAGSRGLDFALTGLIENGSMLGIGLHRAAGSADSIHGAASLEWQRPLSRHLSFALGGRIGVAVPLDNDGAVELGATRYDEFAMSLAAADLNPNGDTLSFRVALPQAVAAGEASIMMPTTMTRSGVNFDPLDVSLVPGERQIDMVLDYMRPLGAASALMVSATHSVNAGHILGEDDTSAAIGWRMEF